jgi:hypothetical protein
MNYLPLCLMIQVMEHHRLRVTRCQRLWLIYTDSEVYRGGWRRRWGRKTRRATLYSLASSLSLLALRWPRLSSRSRFRVVECDEVRIDAPVLIPCRDEVSLQMLVHGPKSVVIVETRVQFRCLADVQSWSHSMRDERTSMHTVTNCSP